MPSINVNIPIPAPLMRLQKFWKGLYPAKKDSLRGSEKPIAYQNAIAYRNIALEIPEAVVRGFGNSAENSVEIARKLLEIEANCDEASSVVGYLARTAFLSDDGDDYGFGVSDYWDNLDTEPIDKKVKAIILDLLNRKYKDEYVIGRLFLKRAMQQVLHRGDSFIEFGLGRDVIGGKTTWGIHQSQYLPTFEMFRFEQGPYLWFEQRRFIEDPDGIVFHPVLLYQISLNRKQLYGRSLFHAQAASGDWDCLKETSWNLARTAQEVNPTIFEFDPRLRDEDRRAYQRDIEYRDSLGPIKYFFQTSAIQMRKLTNSSPDIRSQTDYWMKMRMKMVPSGTPDWLIPGNDTTGARDIAGEPARALIQQINSYRQIVIQAAYHACDLELFLKLGAEEFYKRAKGKYKLVFPKIAIGAYNNQIIENDSPSDGIGDLD